MISTLFRKELEMDSYDLDGLESSMWCILVHPLIYPLRFLTFCSLPIC